MTVGSDFRTSDRIHGQFHPVAVCPSYEYSGNRLLSFLVPTKRLLDGPLLLYNLDSHRAVR